MSDKTTHTPGPWVANGKELNTEQGDYIADFESYDDSDFANARIAGASLDLLYVVERLVLIQGEIPEPLREAARAAIAKAKGTK